MPGPAPFFRLRRLRLGELAIWRFGTDQDYAHNKHDAHTTRHECLRMDQVSRGGAISGSVDAATLIKTNAKAHITAKPVHGDRDY